MDDFNGIQGSFVSGGTAALTAEELATTSVQIDELIVIAKAKIDLQQKHWRTVIGNPAAMDKAAQHMMVLERQLRMLEGSKAEALEAVKQAEKASAAAAFEADAEGARETLETMLEQREELGRALAVAVDGVAAAMQTLYEQGQQIKQQFAHGPIARVSGLRVSDALSINAEDMRHTIDMVLAFRLGSVLWPTATSGADRAANVADSVRREGSPLRLLFNNAVAKRLAALKGS